MFNFDQRFTLSGTRQDIALCSLDFHTSKSKSLTSNGQVFDVGFGNP